MSKSPELSPVAVCLRLPEEILHRLKRLARREAMLRDNDVTYADLIREAVAEAYPEDNEVHSKPEVQG